MIKINEKLAESLDYLLCCPQKYDIEMYHDNWSTNSLYRRFITCDLSEQDIIIPVATRSYVEGYIVNIIRGRIGVTNYNNIIAIPLIKNAQDITIPIRSADVIIKKSIGNGPLFLRRFVTNKDVVYYGTNGCFLDANYNPLLLITLVGNIARSGASTRCNYKEFRIYIHPNVVTNPDDLLNKAILKKVLPYMLNKDFKHLVAYNDFYFTYTDMKVKVIVEDRSDLFHTPVITTNDSELNDLLKSRVADVATYIDTI